MTHKERLAKLKDFYSVYRCHTIFNCTKTCPKVNIISHSHLSYDPKIYDFIHLIIINYPNFFEEDNVRIYNFT